MAASASSAPSTVSKAEAASAASGPSAAKRRRLGRRDTNAQVERTLHEQFRGWTALQTDCIRNDAGKTLREQLAHDIHDSKDEKVRRGSGYYKSLRAQFPLHAQNSSATLAPDKSLTVDAQLERALSLLLHPNTTKQSSGAFRAWLSDSQGCNQREIIGIIKACGHMRPSRNTTNQTAVVLDIAKYVVRTGLSERHPAELATIRSIFDAAFVAQWASMKKNDMSRQSFVDICGESLSLVLDTKALQEVMKNTSDWTSMAGPISQLFNSSQIGERLFSFAWVHVASDTIAKFFDECLAEHPRPLSSTAVSQIKKKCLKQADTLHFGSILDQKRIISCSYREYDVAITVGSLQEEVAMRLSAICKSDSVGSSLTPLAFEKELAMPFPSTPGCDSSVVKDFNAARLAINDYLAQQDIPNGDLLAELVRSKCQLYYQLDPTFCIEVEWVVAVTGQPGLRRMQTYLLALLPSAADAFTVKETMQVLERGMKTNYYKYSSRSAQSLCEALAGVLSALQSGSPLSENHMASSPFLQQVAVSLPHFVKFQQDGTTVISGAPALRAILSDLHSKIHKGDKVTLEQVEPCQLYSHVYTAEEKKTLAEIVDKVLGSASLPMVKRGPAASSGGGSAAKAVKKENLAASLFD